jgi:hypothetical protein
LNGCFVELKTLWEQAELWADLSCFDKNQNISIIVTQATAKLVMRAESRVQAENERLQTVQQIKEEACHLDNLIQKQVQGLLCSSCFC